MIDVTSLRALLSYDPKTGLFHRLNGRYRTKLGWYPGAPTNYGYFSLNILGRQYQAHRLAWALFYGSWPIEQIDHINRVRTDNRIVNLRQATNRENSFNSDTPSNNTSGFRGVVRVGNKWAAQTKVNRKHLWLGRYDTREEAFAAYCEATKKLAGAFYPKAAIEREGGA